MQESILDHSNACASGTLSSCKSNLCNELSIAPEVDNPAAKTRLEVLSAFELNVATLCMYTSSFLSIVYIYISLSSIELEWKKNKKILTENFFEELMSLLLRRASFILSVVYDTALFLDGSPTLEQKWTAALLSFGLVCSNPLSRQFYNWEEQYIYSDAVYSSFIFFYILVTIHSYRILDQEGLEIPSIYREYGYLVSVSVVLRMVSGLFGKVATSSIPFSTIISWSYLSQKDRQSDNITAVVLIVTILDIYLLVRVIKETSHTRSFLIRQKYLENRTKQLGFRYFEYQLMIFFICMMLISVLSIIRLPPKLVEQNIQRLSTIIRLDISTSSLAQFFVFFSWTALLALVNFPPGPLFQTRNRFILRLVYNFQSSSLGRWLRKHRVSTYTTSSFEECDHDSNIFKSIHSKCSRVRDRIPIRYRCREYFEEIDIGSRLSGMETDIIHGDVRTSFPQMKLYSGYDEQEISAHRHVSRSHLHFPEYILEESTETAKRNLREPSRQSNIINPSSNSHYRPPNKELGVIIPMYSGSIAGIEFSAEENRKIGRFREQTLLFSESAQQTHYGSMRSAKNSLRKVLNVQTNTFVMETQVLLAQISYLAYIPGNPNEELSLPYDEEMKVADSMEYENFSGIDDGSKFLVDVAQITTQNGYFIHKQISNKATNTHVTVLYGNGRVIVGFSGTRDKKNWGTNFRMQRIVYDSMFSEFELEIPGSQNFQNKTSKKYDVIEISDVLDFKSSDKPMSRLRDVENSGMESTEVHIVEYEVTQESNGIQVHVGRTRGVLEPAVDKYDSADVNSSISKPLAVNFSHEIFTYGKAKVHSGFSEAYKSVRRYVLGAITELYGGDGSLEVQNGKARLGRKNIPIFFCGHSMGGALAILAAYDAARNFKKIGIENSESISCSTFGSPMVGNEIFKSGYESMVKNHWRFEIASDPVPTLPSSLVSYTHVGRKVLLDQSGTMLIDPSFVETSFWGKLDGLYRRYKLHTRASYISALRSYCRLHRNGSESLEEKFWTFPIKSQTKGIFEILED